MKQLAGLMIAGIFFTACEKFEYDPNETLDAKSPEKLNYANINKIVSKGKDSTIRFAVIGDTHSYYEDMEQIISALNRRNDLDFVVHTGDLTDYGYLTEYKWGTQRLQKLDIPFLVTIGNHDLLGNGDDVYRNMYSALNFSFVYNDTKFIFFDSNSREHNFNHKVPDIAWIRNEISKGSNFHSVVLSSHVPYIDTDFDPALREAYENMLDDTYPDKKIMAALNGHFHFGYDTLYTSRIRHFIPGSSSHLSYYVITIEDGTMTYQRNYAY